MKKCKKCQALIIDAWTTCNSCSGGNEKPITKEQVFSLLTDNRQLHKELLDALRVIEHYQTFHNYFSKEMQPLQKEWAKLHYDEERL